MLLAVEGLLAVSFKRVVTAGGLLAGVLPSLRSW